MSGKIKFFMIFLAVILIAISQSAFIVSETEQALIARFGDLKHSYTTAGLKFKVPFIDTVIMRDKRVLNLDSDDEIKAILADKKQLVVDAFARYKVVDPIKFYQAVKDQVTAESKIDTILDSATRSVLGKQKLTDILSGERSELMEEIRRATDKQTRGFGIEIVDVRIRRADLPKENSESVFNRMKAERQQQAAQFRAEGNQKSVEITSKADKQSQIIIAEAKRDAEIIRGEGDSLRTSIYAQAYNQDKEFFEFYRSLKAYEEVFNGKAKNTIVISPDNEFMKFLR